MTALATTGVWITLSRLTKTLLFAFLEVREWEVPIPTAVISKITGLAFKASSAVAANFRFESSDFTANTFDGSLSVDPTPGMVVVLIPIAWLVPAPKVA